MKNLKTLIAVALILPTIANSQTVLNLPAANVNASTYGNRSNYIINITPGYTFTIDGSYTYTNVTFNGGTVLFSSGISSSSIVTFTNDTTLVNTTPGAKSMNFNGDSVALNATVSFGSGVFEVANSRVAINNTLSLASANWIADSIHVNAAVSYTGNPDSVSDSHITMENGSSWSWSKPIINNSVISMMANSSMSNTGAFTASNSSIFEDGTGTTPTNFSISNSATLTNVTWVLTNAAKASTTSPLTLTGGSITLSGSSSFSPGSTVSLSGADLSLSGTSKFTTPSNLNLTGNSNVTVGDASGAAALSVNQITVTAGSWFGVATNSKISLGSGKVSGPSGTYSPGTINGCATFDGTRAPQTCTTLALGDIILTAAAKGSGEAALSWTDQATTPVNEYLVQRSTGNDTWSPIGTVDANTSATGTYSFIDADAPTGEVFYRIERVAANGTLDYSPISTITFSATAESRVTIFPNPTVGGRFYLTTPGTDATIVNVYTSAGQLLLHAALQGQTQYPIQLPSQTLSLSALVVQTIYDNTTRSFTVLVR